MTTTNDDLSPFQPSFSATELMAIKPPKMIIDGLFGIGDILLLHGTEECFKSVFVLQLAESLATGRPFLRQWTIGRPGKVGIVETEMHPAGLGERLRGMFSEGDAPENLSFMHPDVLSKWRRRGLDQKFDLIERWIKLTGVEFLLLDTVNDFFRAKDDPSSEPIAGKFFDNLRNLKLQGAVCVRHDRKSHEADKEMHSNERIRGSAEFKEDPEVILHLNRQDRRTHEVAFEVGKLRYGRKPPSAKLWFDVKDFRLTPLPPVVAVLEDGQLTRQEVLTQCAARFGLGQSKTDEMLRALQNNIREVQVGHAKAFRIIKESLVDVDWGPLVGGSQGEKYKIV